jgi:heme oxygenase
LHEIPAFAALARGELSLPHYRDLLARLLGLHETVEARTAAHDHAAILSWPAGAPDQGRVARLRRDLDALGMNRFEIAALPRADRHIPALAEVDAALGAVWVVEGSSLGGGVIAKWLGASLGIGPANGGAFFAAAPGQAERWRLCREAIEERGADPRRRAAIIAGAAATFAAFLSWLDGGA